MKIECNLLSFKLVPENFQDRLFLTKFFLTLKSNINKDFKPYNVEFEIKENGVERSLNIETKNGDDQDLDDLTEIVESLSVYNFLI